MQLEQAARAGQAPADVSMMAQVARLRGEKAGLWAPLDPEKMPNIENLPDHFVHRYENGDVYGTGAVSWYITLVTNTEEYPEAPNSWTALWDPANKDKLGLLALASNSFLLEITAATYFGGTDILETEEGVLEVMEKLAEVKPNVRLWYRDEGQFQQALETGEIPMGQYYHDVTGLAASQGKPVRSTFPEEGAVLELGLLGCVEGVRQARRGAGLHQLHGQAGHPGQALALRRHRADRAARADRPDRRGVQRRRLGQEADPADVRALHRPRRLGEPEVVRDDHRMMTRWWVGTHPTAAW